MCNEKVIQNIRLPEEQEKLYFKMNPSMSQDFTNAEIYISKKFSITELNNKIIETSKINKKYKNIPEEKRIYRKVEEIEGECFRFYPYDKKIEVSNYGRIRIGEKIIMQIDKNDKKGYLQLEDWKNYGVNLDKAEYVYHLVAQTWLQNPEDFDCKWDIHHISNDGYDNRPENLIYIKKCQHSQIDHKWNI